jgi:hypothetical protein
MATTCKLIAKATLGSDAAEIDFTSIPATYTDLLLVASLRSADTDGDDDAGLKINAVSTNRSYRILRGNGAAAASFNNTTDFIGTMPAATSTADSFSSFEIYIPNYAGSTNKSLSATAVQETNGTTAYMFAFAGLWSSTSAITQLTLYSRSALNLKTGSSAFLYGITKA